jgi:colanic acid/amylovoran biosynthesis protein
MIQMSAISYVGPPSAQPTLRGMLSGRFMDFYLAGLCRRPMLAWTQSYGPLSTPMVRRFAAMDLRRQPVVFCRGEDCLAAVRDLLPRKEARSYPDIAVTLPYDPEWARDYLRARGWPQSGFAALSPSAVIYAKSRRADGGNGHVEYLREICIDLRERGIPVLVVPHTFRPGRHHPAACDYGTSLELMKRLQGIVDVHLVEEDLSPMQLKSLIALADLQVGGRYHSVVAALSSGVPAISLSWHPKYTDLMRAYGMEDFVIADTDTVPANLIDKLLANREAAAARIRQAHQRVMQQSDENVAAFVELLRRAA